MRLTTLRKISGTLLLAIALAGVCAISSRTIAQPIPSPATLKVVLVDGGSEGIAKDQADAFFAGLVRKLNQFSALTVFRKADLARGMSKEDKIAYEKCSEPACLQQFAAKTGMQRLLFCKLTKKGAVYQFQSTEFDIRRSQKISFVSDNAECSSTEEVDEFIRKVAVKVGQTTTRTSNVPESLQPSGSGIWWYVGSAATVAVGATLYFLVSHSKESAAAPKSLPDPPDLP